MAQNRKSKKLGENLIALKTCVAGANDTLSRRANETDEDWAARVCSVWPGITIQLNTLFVEVFREHASPLAAFDMVRNLASHFLE